jgi:hypothetical protein
MPMLMDYKQTFTWSVEISVHNFALDLISADLQKLGLPPSQILAI